MSINFPNGPSVNDTYTFQGRTWTWTGSAWRIDVNSTATGYTGSTGSTGALGYTGSKGDTGLGFTIAKSYANVAALTADTSPSSILAGQFAIVETGSVDDAENSRLYLWTGSAYNYVTDLSGASGLTGPAGYTGSSGASGYTGSQGTATNWTKRTANYTAASGDRIIADTSGGSFNITLPATPSTGAFVQITDGSNFALNPLTVVANGSTIESQPENVNLDIRSVDLEFIYDGTTWQIISTSGPIGYAGSVGYTGSVGTGYTGSAGEGYTGSSGSTGFTGSGGLGYTGSVGYTGSTAPNELHPFLLMGA